MEVRRCHAHAVSDPANTSTVSKQSESHLRVFKVFELVKKFAAFFNALPHALLAGVRVPYGSSQELEVTPAKHQSGTSFRFDQEGCGKQTSEVAVWGLRWEDEFTLTIM